MQNRRGEHGQTISFKLHSQRGQRQGLRTLPLSSAVCRGDELCHTTHPPMFIWPSITQSASIGETKLPKMHPHVCSSTYMIALHMYACSSVSSKLNGKYRYVGGKKLTQKTIYHLSTEFPSCREKSIVSCPSVLKYSFSLSVSALTVAYCRPL